MTLRLRSDADMDYAESVLYYLTQETPQSAERFTKELEIAYREIREAPYQTRVDEYGFREKMVKGFPFSILYSVEESEIVVVAIYHDKRKRVKLRDRV